MSALKTQARRAAGRLAWAVGRREPAAGTLSILMYHAVTAAPIDDAGQMSVSAALFGEHMRAVADLPVDVLPLEAAVDRLRRGAIERPAVSIVFDDGFAGVHDHAAPVLASHGFAATVFVTTSWVGLDAFPGGDRRLGRPLSWSEAAALPAAGIAIGNHTHTHRCLGAIDGAGVAAELRASQDAIEARVASRPTAFAYPFGGYGTFTAGTRRALQEQGFSLACTTVWGRNRSGHDPMTLCRIRVSWVDRPDDLRRSLAGCHDWYRWVQRLQAIGPSRRGEAS